MDSNQNTDRRVTRSQIRDLPQPSLMAADNSPGLNLPVASTEDHGTPVPTSAAVGTLKEEALNLEQKTSPASRIMPVRQDGSDGQSANSGFMLPVEQVLEMQKRLI